MLLDHTNQVMNDAFDTNMTMFANGTNTTMLESNTNAEMLEDSTDNTDKTAILEDDLAVSTEIELVSKARTIFFQSVSNIKNDTLICKGEVEDCFIDNDSGKPKAFPVGLLNLFES